MVLVPDRELRPTALGIIRCLGSSGVPVVALASRRNTPSFYSRYVTRRLLVPSLRDEPANWVSTIAEIAAELDHKPVLYPTADEQVWALHQFRDRLSSLILYGFMDVDSLRNCMDKRDMYSKCQDAGISTGQVICDIDPAHPEKIIDDVVFPSVLKPASWVDLGGSPATRNRPFQQLFGSKAVSINNKDELKNALNRLASVSVPVLLQEEIPGPSSNIHHVSVYADQSSETRGIFVARKRRQFPSKFGNACLIETHANTEVTELTKTLIRALGFKGVSGGIEFKRHARTGALHFVEINPRAGAMISAVKSSGANLPHLAYLDAVGATIPDVTVGDQDVRWIDSRHDILYWLAYRNGDHTGRILTLREFLRSRRGRREYAYWSAVDPLPAVAQSASAPRSVLTAVLTRTRRAYSGRGSYWL